MGNVYSIKGNGAQNMGNIPTISLGQISTNNLGQVTGNIGDLLKQISQNEHIKKYEVFESEEDFLALSVAWHRLRKERETGMLRLNLISSLTDSELYKNVKQEDRERANVIRDFFQKKFLMLALKNIPLTQFRKDLQDYVNGNSKIVQENKLPLIYRLPEFYDYDVEFDSVKRDFNFQIDEFKNIGRIRASGKVIKKLYPIKMLTKNTKRMKYHEYWMYTDTRDLVVMVLELKNSLQHLWDREFAKPFINVESFFIPKSRDDVQYYQLGNWQVL